MWPSAFGLKDLVRSEGTTLAKPLVAVFNARFSATKFFLVGKIWWAQKDSNLRPQSYQGCALTN